VSQADDLYLVHRAQDGYVDAYEELVARHGPRVYRTALRIVGNPQDAQDVTQDTFIVAWQSLSGFRGESTVTTWLYRIATNRSLNKVTRDKVTTPLEWAPDLPDTASGPAAETERSASADAVTAAISALPAVQRVPLVLHQFEELSYADIAAVTGTSVAAVRSHLHRARRTLATTLHEWR